MRTLARACLVVLCLTTVAGAQRGGGGGAQPADAGPFGALRWRSLGPPRGGRSIAVAGSDARPYEYYMGATGGGLWKTTDAGASWKPVTLSVASNPYSRSASTCVADRPISVSLARASS